MTPGEVGVCMGNGGEWVIRVTRVTRGTQVATPGTGVAVAPTFFVEVVDVNTPDGVDGAVDTTPVTPLTTSAYVRGLSWTSTWSMGSPLTNRMSLLLNTSWEFIPFKIKQTEFSEGMLFFTCGSHANGKAYSPFYQTWK
jgi:hypothetical protein